MIAREHIEGEDGYAGYRLEPTDLRREMKLHRGRRENDERPTRRRFSVLAASLAKYGAFYEV